MKKPNPKSSNPFRPPRVVLFIVAAPFSLAYTKVIVRRLLYERRGSMLFALDREEAANLEHSETFRDAPLGAQRVKASELPKSGGLDGLSVIAEDEDHALELMAVLLQRKLAEKEKELEVLRHRAKKAEAAITDRTLREYTRPKGE